MYCLTFIEGLSDGPETRVYYYFNYMKAVEMQRAILINEINSLIEFQTDEKGFDFFEYDNSKMSNSDLQRLLKILIELTYRCEKYQITVTIDDIHCEDKPLDI